MHRRDSTAPIRYKIGQAIITVIIFVVVTVLFTVVTGILMSGTGHESDVLRTALDVTVRVLFVANVLLWIGVTIAWLGYLMRRRQLDQQAAEAAGQVYAQLDERNRAPPDDVDKSGGLLLCALPYAYRPQA